MTRLHKIGTYSVLAAAAIVGMTMVSCGGGGGGSEDPLPTVSRLDETGAQHAIDNVKGFMSICAAPTGDGDSRVAAPGLVSKALMWRKARLQGVADPATKRALAFSSTPPPDALGDCGGRLTYENYSHASGVTRATLRFDNYCTVDADTSNRQTVNGGVAFVNTATPTSSGPITTRLEASSAGGIVVRSNTASGALIEQQTASFTGFEYAAGVPGGTPTAANPDTMRLANASFTNAANVTYRESNVALTMFETPAGDTQLSLSGRGYRSNGEYFDYATTAPMVMNPDGDFTGGAMRFSGAEGSNVVVTLVPGPVMQATITVNGKPMPSLPACK